MKNLRINAVYKKELKTSMRSMRIALTLLAYNGILALIGLITFFAVFQQASYGGIDNSQILMVYMTLVCLEFGLVLFVIPAYTSSAISGERERQTLEIMLTTTMKPSQIIRGKLLASISTLLLLVFSSLPILSLVFTIGGVSVKDLLQYVALVLVTSVYAGSLGLLFSVWFRKTAISTVTTYGTLLFLGLGTLALLFVGYVMLEQYYDAQYFTGAIASSRRPDLGFATCILMLNPAFSIASMLCGQFGGSDMFLNFVGEFGTLPEFVIDHWFVLSLVVQMAISAGVLALAAFLLNPLNRKSKGRKSRKRKEKGAAARNAEGAA